MLSSIRNRGSWRPWLVALVIGFMSASCSSVSARTYAHCVLDKLPKAQNDLAANAIHQVCLSEFPGGLTAVPQGAGRGWFSYKSGADCAAKESTGTQSQRVAYAIRIACNRLYDAP